MKKCWIYTVAAVCTTLFTAAILGGCKNKEDNIGPIGLFSWKDSAVYNERDTLFQVMEEKNVRSLYQALTDYTEQEELFAFAKEARDRGIDIYCLTGAPEWALDEAGDVMLDELDKVLTLNKILPGTLSLKGIVFDVEPYLLEQWDEDEQQKAIMAQFVARMEKAYKKAHENGLGVIACIPYYFDSKGYARELETLIARCCDSVAVMNYYRGKEREHIETEAALAKTYGKELINVYELQPAGEHGLTDKNTYHAEGFTAAAANFMNLKQVYDGQEIKMALHDYESLKEMTGNE